MQFYLTVLTLSSTTAVLAAVPTYGQCGGNGFTGDKTCASGNECKSFNPWYSQCLPAGAGSGSAPGTGAPAPSMPAGTGGVALPTTMMTRASSVVAVPTSSVVVTPSTPSSVSAAAAGANGAQCSLNKLFVAKGKKYLGNIADPGTLGDKTNTQIIKDNFGQLTPENS